MAFYDQAVLSADTDFQQRIAACAQTEGLVTPPDQPIDWAFEHQWAVAAAPGFADAYASAVESGVERPGRDPSVISDAQILSAVQALPAETP
jgi:hypothetical protein